MADSDGKLTHKDWGEFALGIASVATKYPIWASIFLITELVQGAFILAEYQNGSITPLEIEERLRVTTVLGMLGGGSAEALVRFAKWTTQRLAGR